MEERKERKQYDLLEIMSITLIFMYVLLFCIVGGMLWSVLLNLPLLIMINYGIMISIIILLIAIFYYDIRGSFD